MTAKSTKTATETYILNEEDIMEAIMFWLTHKKDVSFPANVIINKTISSGCGSLQRETNISYTTTEINEEEI